MEITPGQEYHHFIEISAGKMTETEKFPEFEYMEYAIKKNYKLLKKSKIQVRPNEKFTDFFKSLDKQEQIKYYQKCINLLGTALSKNVSSQQRKNQRQQLKKQGQAFIKKTLINKWEKKFIKIQNLVFYVQDSKKQRAYPLKFYAIRKSKNKQHYGWVLQAIGELGKRKLKTIHCGVRNFKDFQHWFQLIEKSIDCAKIDFYRNVVLGLSRDQEPKQNRKNYEGPCVKTITEIFIDNQMKIHEDFEDQMNNIIEEDKQKQIEQQQSSKNIKLHPNVFKRLFPNVNIDLFTQNSPNSSLVQSGTGYRLYELPPYPGYDFRLRINLIVPFNKSLLFKALTEELNLWHNEIQIFSVKTKISSENSALIYQKNKAQGLLYRERDYLYFRHTFSIKPNGQNDKNKIYIADKSIDSISYPPFMTVARGQKKLVHCIIGNQEQSESMLIVQGQLKGGGYMNTANDKEMTVKFLKTFLGLEGYLKEKRFTQENQKAKDLIFQEDWEVDQEQEEFFDIENPDADSEEEEEDKQVHEKCKKEEDKNRKFSSTSDEQNQFEEFIKKTSEEITSIQNKSEVKEAALEEESLTFSKVYPYTPPAFSEDKTVIIPQQYIKVRHTLSPLQKGPPALFPHYRGHHLYKGEWAICPTGGLNYVDEEKMNEQKKVLTFIIKRIGRNILSGKGILNISLPVDIFCRESNIERFAASFSFAPMYLEKAALVEDPKEQLKYIIGVVHLSSLIYLTMEKPFNPILGQTYQSWIDGCPVYFQQICHHPPIASYLMIGRGYKLYGTLEAKMDISINSGTGTNEGIFTVEFDNGRKFYYTTSAGQLSGLTYGERKLLLVGKTYYWCIEEGLFMQVQYNPSSKNRRFFGGSNVSTAPDAQYHDYIEGTLKKYRKEDLEEFLAPKKGDFRKIMAIPKSSPTAQPLNQIYKVSGRWTKYIAFDGKKMFDVDESRYYTMKDEEYPLASHSNYREDIVYRRLNNFVLSQEFKEVLETKQRKDRKLRQAQEKNRK